MPEVAVALAIVLTLVTILYVGARGWKGNSDRAGCIEITRNAQAAVRAFQTFNGYSAGGYPNAENGTQDIGILMLNNRFIERNLYDALRGAKTCPGGGTYSVPFPDVFPIIGSLYMTCSLASVADHTPSSLADW